MHDHDAVTESGPAPKAPPLGAPESGDPAYAIHMGLAEQGKLHALAKEYRLALYYYRKAMQLAVEHAHPEIFFRHYLECVVEALEQLRSFREVLDYCDRALALYGKTPPQDDVARRDLAHIYQRLGVVQLKLGEPEAARAALRKGLDVITRSGGGRQSLPLAQTLLRWIELGVHIDERRVIAEQERTRYFSVRKDTVAAERALRLPDEIVARECPR